MIDDYQKLFESLQIKEIAKSLDPSLRVFYFYQNFAQLFLHHIRLNPIDPAYTQGINQLFKKLIYQKREQYGPICSKIISKYYRCYDCQNIDCPKVSICICQDCFKLGEHHGHNFRLIKTSTSRAICDCGDENWLDQKFFCHKHKGESKMLEQQQRIKINEEDEDLFIGQMQFLLYIFVRLREIEEGLLDQQKKKDIFGVQIIAKIEQFASKSYPNQNLIATFFNSNFRFAYPQVSEKFKDKKMLHIMLRCARFSDFMDKLCNRLLLSLYCVKMIRQIVLIQVFQYASSITTFLNGGCPLSKVAFQFLKAEKQIQQLLVQEKIMLPVINYKFTNFKQKKLAFITLFQNYEIILRTKSAQKIIQRMSKQINICQMCMFCTDKEQRFNQIHVLQVQIEYFKLLSEITKLSMKSKYKQKILKKIISEAYYHLKQKKQSISLSVERTFAFAFFTLLDCSTQKIYEMQQQYLLKLLGKESLPVLINTIKKLIKEVLHLMKIDNFLDYKGMILTESDMMESNKLIISIDGIYVRILVMMLIKLEKPFEGEMIEPFVKFLQVRSKAINKLYQLYLQDKVSKTESTMSMMMQQVCFMVNYFLNLSESSICQVIVRNYLGVGQEHETIQVFQMLTYVHLNSPKRELKYIAENYINSPKMLQKFIKEDYVSQKQAIRSGKVLKNNSFNLSYNSLYSTAEDFPEYSALYYLKASDPRRLKLSGVVFGAETIFSIKRFFCQFADIYDKSLKYNEIATTKNAMLTMFETLVMIYLDRRQNLLKKLIDDIIKCKMLLQERGNNYYQQIVKMYQKCQQKVKLMSEGEIMNSVMELGDSKQKAEMRLKRQKKMNQLKLKQTTQVQKMTNNGIIPKLSQRHNEQQRQCIICKMDSLDSKLYYICYCRYSNFLSQNLLKQEYPIILISTCGHLIHKTCFKLNIQRQEMQGFSKYCCFLCKANCNLFVPVETCTTEQAMNFFEDLKNIEQKLGTFFFEMSRQYMQQAQKAKFHGRIIISLLYQIFGYSLYYPKYMALKILPVLRYIIGSLRAVGVKRQTWLEVEKYLTNIQKMDSFAVFEFISRTLQTVIEKGLQTMFTKEMGDNLRLAESIEKDLCGKQRHKQIICMVFDQIEGKSSQFVQYSMNVRSPQCKGVFKLPSDLCELNRYAGVCPKCSLLTSKIMICYLCGEMICEECKQALKQHIQKHFGQTAYVKIERGECVYYTDKSHKAMFFLYQDYVGDEIQEEDDGTFPEKGQYMLSNDKRNVLVEDMVNNQIKFKIKQKKLRQQIQ